MYKFLLCTRYLRTRYIALASIISVTLGVATMIVVNAVMAGFTAEMRDKIHGILADVIFEAHSLEGFPDAEWHMQEIRRVAGNSIAEMSPVVQVPAMLNFQAHGQWISRPVQLVGIDERTQGETSEFARYLQHPQNRQQMAWELREGGYDVRHPDADPGSPERDAMAKAGWEYRRRRAAYDKVLRESSQAQPESLQEDLGADPFAAAQPEQVFDPAKEQFTGLVLGSAIAGFRVPLPDDPSKSREMFHVLPGDDVKLTFPTSGTPPEAVSETFTIVDFYESRMAEYDSQLVFVPISKLQELRGMIDPQTGIGAVTSIQIKLKEGVNLNEVRDKLRAAFSPQFYSVSTWRDKQGPLLAAVDMETAILNILLFLIIAVAGFGILAIFFMIVVEKTRDIGILKSMGASKTGIMNIFLGYGVSLGVVGSGAGLALGLWFVAEINNIREWLGQLTGHEVFDPAIYYFYQIPTIVEPFTVTWIVLGAVGIAVMASILPARRAAALEPVEALRYE